MSDRKRSVRLPEWLDDRVTDWCALYDTTFSRVIRKALEKFFMADKHSKHILCDLVEEGTEIKVIPNPNGKWLVSVSADQETLRELYERGQVWL